MILEQVELEKREMERAMAAAVTEFIRRTGMVVTGVVVSYPHVDTDDAGELRLRATVRAKIGDARWR